MGARARDWRDLATALQATEEALATRALACGLAATRPRSTSARLRLESSRMVALVAGALHVPHTELRLRVADEVRRGALAAASPAQTRATLAVWRTTLGGASSMAAPEDRTRVDEALCAIEREALPFATAWHGTHVDVIVVGASAGGVPPLVDFLQRFDADLPATLLVVMHLSPTSPSTLGAILGRRARLPVAQPFGATPLMLGHAIVAAPARHLLVADGALLPGNGPPVLRFKPSIDLLFTSAARAHRRRVASVVLSGAGHDGAIGTLVVRRFGGHTFAQSPSTARFGEMPEAAIATGAIEVVADVGSIAARLVELATTGMR